MPKTERKVTKYAERTDDRTAEIAEAHYKNLIDPTIKEASLRACARTAGIAPPSIYYYYCNKKALNIGVFSHKIVQDSQEYQDIKNRLLKHLKNDVLLEALLTGKSRINVSGFPVLQCDEFKKDLAEIMYNYLMRGSK